MSRTVIDIKIEGADELIKKLRQIDKTLRAQAAKEAVEEGAGVIMPKAIYNAPVKYGTLRNSFRIESRNVGDGAVAEFGPHVIYGRIHEYGGYAGRNHSVHIKAKHYLNNAIEEKKNQAAKAMGDVISEYLAKS